MNIGLIFAGGVGSRMRSKGKPKQFLEIHNKAIIIHTIEHFEKNEEIDAIVIVCVKEWIEYLKELIMKFNISKVQKVVVGGETGQLSIFNGMVAAKEVAGKEKAIVLIHDGVRPMINSELLSKNIACVKENGSSITCAVVKETIVEIDNEERIKTVVSRPVSRVAKAPQCFWLDEIINVSKDAINRGKCDYIDSCTMMQDYGYKMFVTDGPYENIKITTPDDFYTMRAILQVKEDAQLYSEF